MKPAHFAVMSALVFSACLDLEPSHYVFDASAACAADCVPAPFFCKDAMTLVSSRVRACNAAVCQMEAVEIACASGCAQGACVGEPCAGVFCATPPAPSCVGSVLRAVVTAGTCNAGACVYATTDTACAAGCESGGCVNEPCAGRFCQQPPPSRCIDATTLRVSASLGSCDAVSGSCQYGFLDTRCASGCSAGACVNEPCASLVCDSPPATSCASSSARLVPASTGTCAAGACQYAGSVSACTGATQCAAGLCSPAGGPADAGTIDSSTWSLVVPPASPPASTDQSMSFDPLRSVAVLVVSNGISITQLASTWEWNGTTWSPRTTPTTGPFGGNSYPMAWDAARQRTVHFGSIPPNAFNVPIYEWDGATWLKTPPATPMAIGLTWPAELWNSALAWDAPHQELVLFGGRGTDLGPLSGLATQTWTLKWSTPTTPVWTDRAPQPSPPGRYRHAMAFDAQRGVTVLFGGTNGTETFSDTWSWNGSAWSLLHPVPAPPRRHGHAMVYDPVRQRVVLFGGTSEGNALNDTWEWDGAAWTQRTPTQSPPVRSGHAMAWDSARGTLLLYGGDNGASALNDTWVFNPGSP